MWLATTLAVLTCLSAGGYWAIAGARWLRLSVSAGSEVAEPIRASIQPCCTALGPPESSPEQVRLPAPADVGRVVAVFNGEPPMLHHNSASPSAKQSQTSHVQPWWPSLKRAPRAVVAIVSSEVVEQWLQGDSCLIDPQLLTRPVRPDHERYARRYVPDCKTFTFDNGAAEVTNPAPGSLWRAFALRPGDRLGRVNGYKLSHPEDALHLYTSLPRPLSAANTCLVFTFERRDVILPPRILCLEPPEAHALAKTGGAARGARAVNQHVERVFWPVYEVSGIQVRNWLTQKDDEFAKPQFTPATTEPGRYEHPWFTLSREGVLVRDASRGTPFHTLGLKVDDRVETLNGEDFSTAQGVLESYRSLREAALSSKLACVRLGVVRKGRPLTPRVACLMSDD